MGSRGGDQSLESIVFRTQNSLKILGGEKKDRKRFLVEFFPCRNVWGSWLKSGEVRRGNQEVDPGGFSRPLPASSSVALLLAIRSRSALGSELALALHPKKSDSGGGESHTSSTSVSLFHLSSTLPCNACSEMKLIHHQIDFDFRSMLFLILNINHMISKSRNQKMTRTTLLETTSVTFAHAHFLSP